jgi:predicted O-linked N-acetylglucosamine transferase (SPINDLY family)
LSFFHYYFFPLQVNYLIFPGTSGAPWADYLLCDKRVAPPDLAFAYPTTTNADDEGVGVCPEGLRRGGESIYSEKLVYLPNSYQVNQSRLTHAPSPPLSNGYYGVVSVFR